MVLKAEDCEEEDFFMYNRNLVQVMKQHRLINAAEEEQLTSYLFTA